MRANRERRASKLSNGRGCFLAVDSVYRLLIRLALYLSQVLPRNNTTQVLGTGIGLATTKIILERSGGTVSFVSEEGARRLLLQRTRSGHDSLTPACAFPQLLLTGQGTTFTMTMPLRRAERAQRAARSNNRGTGEDPTLLDKAEWATLLAPVAIAVLVQRPQLQAAIVQMLGCYNNTAASAGTGRPDQVSVFTLADPVSALTPSGTSAEDHQHISRRLIDILTDPSVCTSGHRDGRSVNEGGRRDGSTDGVTGLPPLNSPRGAPPTTRLHVPSLIVAIADAGFVLELMQKVRS